MDTDLDDHVVTPAGTRVNIIALSFTLIAGMVVFLRMFTRLFMIRKGGFEDVSILLAMTASIVLAIATSDQATHGLGKHGGILDDHDENSVLKAFWISVWVYNLALILTKVSILLQYLRIFPIAWFRKACYGMLGLVIAYGSWAVFSSIFICYPVTYSWDKTIQDGRCMNEMIVWFTNAGMNIGEDIIILLLPLPVIQTLHMPRGQKQGLIIMLLLGASVTVISIVRLYSLDDISNSIDISFDNVAHATLSDIEVNVGIICACLPAMRPLFALIVPEYFSPAPHYTKTEVVDIEKSGHLRTASSSGKNTGQTNTPRTGRSRTSTPRTGTPRSGTPRAVTPPLPRPTISRTSTGHFAINHPSRPHTSGQSSSNHSRSGSNTSIDTAKIRSPAAARLPLSVSSRPNTPHQYSQTTVKHSRSASNLSADQSGRFPVSSSSRTWTPRSNVVKHSRSASNITVDTGLARARPPRFQGRIDPLRMSPVSPPTAMRFSSLSPFTNPRPIHEVFGHARSSSVPPRMPGSTKPLPVTPFPVAGRP